MFRLGSGSVRLSVICEEGRELLYQLFGPGDCFGTSSVVDGELRPHRAEAFEAVQLQVLNRAAIDRLRGEYPEVNDALRSEEHTSELQSLMRISYAVFCLKKKLK